MDQAQTKAQSARRLTALAVAALAGSMSMACSTLPDEDFASTPATTPYSNTAGYQTYTFGTTGTNTGVSTDSLTQAIVKAYSDILGTTPDAGTQASLLAQLNAGTLTVAQMRTNIAVSLQSANNIRTEFIKFFNRVASDSEVATWQGYLANGAVTYATLDSAFTNTGAFGGTSLAFSRQSYIEILGRNPSQAEVDSIRAQVQAGAQYVNLRYNIAVSDESRNRFNSVFGMIFSRGPNGDETNYWLSQLANGLKMSDIEVQMLTSPDFTNIYPGVNTYVAQSYAQVLGRPMDGGGQATYVTAIGNGSMTYSTMRQFLVTSAEATNAINAVYQATLGRAANGSELYAQRTFLNSGGDLISMREGVVMSAECHGTPACTGGQ